MLTEHAHTRVVILRGGGIGPAGLVQGSSPGVRGVTALMDLTGQRVDLAITTPTQARNARKVIRALAVKVLHDADRANDVELMAGEAIANGWLHGTKPITVAVTAAAGRLRVEVRDRGPGLPVIPRGDYRRGLCIIEKLATTWCLLREDAAAETVLTFDVDY